MRISQSGTGPNFLTGPTGRGVRTILLVLSMGIVFGGCVVLKLPKKVAAPFGGIPNFRTCGLAQYRGAQPDRAGFDYLWGIGVRTVVKLNTPEEGDDSYAEQLGMTVIRIPITTWQQLLGPVPVKPIDVVVRSLPAGSFIHCGSTARSKSWWSREMDTQGGQDRTGFFCYRLRRLQGWSKAAAVEELLGCGFHKTEHALWKCVEGDE